MVAGRKLNERIAVEVMGFIVEQMTDPGGDVGPWYRIDGESDPADDIVGWCPVADYSTDIAAAWEVVEYMRAKDEWAFTLGTDTDGDWDATFWEGDTFHDATADTAPHAICLAALKAIGAEV